MLMCIVLVYVIYYNTTLIKSYDRIVSTVETVAKLEYEQYNINSRNPIPGLYIKLIVDKLTD